MLGSDTNEFQQILELTSLAFTDPFLIRQTGPYLAIQMVFIPCRL